MAQDEIEVALEAVQPGLSAVGTIAGNRRVLVGPIDPCGECEVCRRGGASVCPQLRRRDFAGPTAIAAMRWLVELGDGLDIPGPSAAAVAGDVAIAYTLYARANLAPRDPVVVTGATPIARFLIDILRGKDIAPVVVVGADAPDAWRDELARKNLPVATLSDRPARDVVADAMPKEAASRPWRVLATAPDPLAAAIAGPRATLAAYASVPVTAAWSHALADAVGREVAVTGIARAHPELVLETAAMVSRGDIDLEAGVTLGDDRMRTRVTILRR